ncbi:MAG: hypothetical protein JST92_25100 [Deltaproteobacteria bacterium]|nr:hypothetical protein [Deltaproteobacteria bacterium]
MKTRVITAVLALAALSLSACDEEPSASISTTGLKLNAHVTVNEDGSDVFMSVDKPGSAWDTDYTLSGSDSLWIDLSGGRKQVDDGALFGGYWTKFDGDELPSTVQVGFSRSGADMNATVPMPQKFALLAPAIQSTWSRSQPLTLRWTSPARDSVQITVTGDCIEQAQFDVQVPESGTFTVPAGSLHTAAAYPASATCWMAVGISRIQQSVTPAPFVGGTLIGERNERFLLSSSQ